MKTRFVVPAAVAMALHAFLLLGFRTDHPAVVGVVRPVTRATPPRDKPLTVEWSVTRDDEETPSPKGVPDEARPNQPEPIVPESATDFRMTPSVPIPTPDHPATKLTIGPIGKPEGKDRWTDSDGVGSIGATHLDNPPRTRSQIAPVYPYEARIAGIPGEVLVEFIVDESGRVLDPHVVRSNDPAFEAPTLRAIAKWRFEPGRKAGRVVRFRMAVPVAFAINP